MVLDVFYQAQGRGLPECGSRSAFHEPARCPPLSECHRIGQGSTAANNRPRRFDVGAGVKQCIECRDIIAARGPVERRLGVPSSKWGIDDCTRRDQGGDSSGSVREVTGPVRSDVQQRARRIAGDAGIVDDSHSRQVRVVTEQALQALDIAVANRSNHGDRERMVGLQSQM